MSLLKENKIHLHGFTDGFTYNNVDYFLDNRDKDVYELYFKEVKNELIKFKCDVLEFKEDIEHINKVRTLTTPSHHEVELKYKNFIKTFELYKTHFVIFLYTQDDTRDFYKVIDILKDLWMMVDMYVISKCFTVPKQYTKFLKVEEVPGMFTNTLKKLEKSVLRDKLKKVNIENLKKY